MDIIHQLFVIVRNLYGNVLFSIQEGPHHVKGHRLDRIQRDF